MNAEVATVLKAAASAGVDRDALLTAVLNDPADDTTRLVLADLLRESDDPEDQTRGRFLWAGVTFAHFSDDPRTDDPLLIAARGEMAGFEPAAGFYNPRVAIAKWE